MLEIIMEHAARLPIHVGAVVLLAGPERKDWVFCHVCCVRVSRYNRCGALILNLGGKPPPQQIQTSAVPSR